MPRTWAGAMPTIGEQPPGSGGIDARAVHGYGFTRIFARLIHRYISDIVIFCNVIHACHP
jgi:hypothetical protein